MERLINAKLYRSELLPIKSKVMVERYNRCLIDLGITPTNLKRFSIDALGWSPEIAAEKEDLFYLGAGLANPMAIILSPDQFSKPAYAPFNSYDKPALDAFYRNFQYEITDITSTHAIGIDIDDSLISYSSPLDLFLIDYVVLKVIMPGLTKGAEEQAKLVDRFTKNPLGWMDKNLRDEIIDSAKNYGDLRYRRLKIPPFQYNELKNFHTRAFGGVFVLSVPKGKEGHIAVLEKTSPDIEKYIDSKKVFSIDDKNLLAELVNRQIIEFNPLYWEEHLDRLADIILSLKVKAISDVVTEEDLVGITEAKVKSLLNAHDTQFDDDILALEKAYKNFQKHKIVSFDKLSEQVQATLCTPVSLGESTVWKILNRKNYISPVELFNTDRLYFYNKYQRWESHYRDWVVDRILEKNNVDI